MKIFNISVRVTATQIGEIPDMPAEAPADEKKPFNDDPVDKQDAMLTKYMDRIEKLMGRGPGFGMLGFATEVDGASSSESVRIAVSSFDDLQAVLKKFSETIHGLPAAPDSLLASIQPGGPTPG
jgi:hypothetical protein